MQRVLGESLFPARKNPRLSCRLKQKAGKKRKKNTGTKVRRLMHGLNDAAEYRQWSFASMCSGDAQNVMNGTPQKKGREKNVRHDLLANRTVWCTNVLTICSFLEMKCAFGKTRYRPLTSLCQPELVVDTIKFGVLSPSKNYKRK